MYKIKFPYILLSAVIFISLHLIFLKTKFYGNRGWVDIPLHFVMGMFLGAICLWWVNKSKNQNVISQKSLVMVLFLFGLFGGIVWEGVELILWNFLPGVGDYVEIKKTALRDMISDLSTDILGSLSWFIFVTINKWQIKNGKKSW